MRKDYIGTLYTGVSDAFQAGENPIARCLKAEKHDLSVVEIIKLTERIDMKNGNNKILRQDKTRQDKSQSLDAWMDLRASIGCISLMVYHLQYVPIAVEIRRLRFWK